MVLEAVIQDGLALEEAVPALRSDYDLMEAALKGDASCWNPWYLYSWSTIGLSHDPNLMATALRYEPNASRRVSWVVEFEKHHNDLFAFFATRLARFVGETGLEVPRPQNQDWEGAVFVDYATNIWKRAQYEKIFVVTHCFQGWKLLSQELSHLVTDKEEVRAANLLIKYAPLLATLTLTQGLTWKDFVGKLWLNDMYQKVEAHYESNRDDLPLHMRSWIHQQ